MARRGSGNCSVEKDGRREAHREPGRRMTFGNGSRTEFRIRDLENGPQRAAMLERQERCPEVGRNLRSGSTTDGRNVGVDLVTRQFRSIVWREEETSGTRVNNCCYAGC